MFFLIEYDRVKGRIIEFRAFPESQRSCADDARLELELRLNRENVEREVVVLEAANEDAVRKTHRRYFERVEELAGRESGS